MAYKDPEKRKAYEKARYQANKEERKAYYQANKEKCKAYKKAYYQENKEKINLRQKAYDKAHKEEKKASCKSYYQANKEKKKAYQEANKEKISAGQKAHYQANKEKFKAKAKAYYQENKEKTIASVLIYRKNRRKTDPTFRIMESLRARVKLALKGKNKSKSTMELIGCTVDEFWLHLEKQFQPGMTRENHGFGEGCWHVDHIKPCSSFDLLDLEQQKICFHYTNCQPLWQRDNLSKGAKFDG